MALLLIWGAVLGFLWGAPGAWAGETPVGSANLQLVLVISEDWSSSEARLQLFERRSGQPWSPVPATQRPWRTRIGRNGMAWGGAPGISECPAPTCEAKREGDGKSPAGVFPLLRCFGRAEEKAALEPGDGLPFLTLSPGWEGVDDVKSPHYNQVVEPGSPKDWDSAESMWVPEYRLGLQVGYNTDPVVPGRGSCIFVHILSEPERATSGCTAMTTAQIRQVCQWLRRSNRPVIVQLPRPVYDKVRRDWGLP